MQLQVIIEFLRKTASFTIKSRTLKVPCCFFEILMMQVTFSSCLEMKRLYFDFNFQSGSIRVYCRVRPFLHGQSSYLSAVDQIEDGTITINTPSKHGKGHRSFNFNKVFGPSATQGWLVNILWEPFIILTLPLFHPLISSTPFFFLQGRCFQTHSHWLDQSSMVTMSAFLHMAKQDQGKHIPWLDMKCICLSSTRD